MSLLDDSQSSDELELDLSTKTRDPWPAKDPIAQKLQLGPDSSTLQIMRGIACGSDTARNYFCLRYEKLLNRCLARFNLHPFDPEDLSHEVLRIACSKIEAREIDFEKPIEPWLLKVARNKALEKLRSEKRFQKAKDKMAAEIRILDKMIVPPISTKSQMYCNEIRHEILKAINNLLSGKHKVVALADFYDPLYKADTFWLARVIGVEPQTVQKYRCDYRKKLAESETLKAIWEKSHDA